MIAHFNCRSNMVKNLFVHLLQFLPLRTRILIHGRLVRLRLIRNFILLSDNGLNRKPRTMKIIVSLTSFPQRMKYLHFTLCSLLKQTLKPDEIILWLGEEQFPGKERDIPKKVQKLQKLGVKIKWCKDTKSYKKLLPALKEYPNDIIVTADDDVYYSTNWLALLYKGYSESPDYINCHRARRISFDEDGKILPYSSWENVSEKSEPSFLNFIIGVGGVLYPPKLLHKDVLNEELFLKLSPFADDIWFWAMSVLNGTKINVVKDNIFDVLDVCPERNNGEIDEITLFSINYGQNKNDEQFHNVLDCYNLIYILLKQ